MWSPIREVIDLALDTDNKHASHILLIPFITATLIYWYRKAIFNSVQYSGAGAVVIALGLALFAGGSLWTGPSAPNLLSLKASSLVVMWLGGFLFFYGSAAFRAGLFPLLFLLLCIPFPPSILDYTIAFLQRGSAEMTYVLLKLSGTPVYREGFVFAMPDLTIFVAPECSGIRSSISLFILSILAGHLFLRSPWRWFVLMIVTIPLVIFKNAVRIGTLSLLTLHVDRGILSSRLHQEGGIPFFIVGLLMIYPVLMMLVKSERKSMDANLIKREANL